jgi:hypothetical protein
VGASIERDTAAVRAARSFRPANLESDFIATVYGKSGGFAS